MDVPEIIAAVLGITGAARMPRVKSFRLIQGLHADINDNMRRLLAELAAFLSDEISLHVYVVYPAPLTASAWPLDTDVE